MSPSRRVRGRFVLNVVVASLGAIKDWEPELRTLITGILASPFREVVIWGEDLIMI